MGGTLEVPVEVVKIKKTTIRRLRQTEAVVLPACSSNIRALNVQFGSLGLDEEPQDSPIPKKEENVLKSLVESKEEDKEEKEEDEDVVILPQVATPKPEPQPQLQLQPQVQLQPQHQPQPQPQPQQQPQLQLHLQPQPQLQPQPEREPQFEPEREPEPVKTQTQVPVVAQVAPQTVAIQPPIHEQSVPVEPAMNAYCSHMSPNPANHSSYTPMGSAPDYGLYSEAQQWAMGYYDPGVYGHTPLYGRDKFSHGSMNNGPEHLMSAAQNTNVPVPLQQHNYGATMPYYSYYYMPNPYHPHPHHQPQQPQQQQHNSNSNNKDIRIARTRIWCTSLVMALVELMITAHQCTMIMILLKILHNTTINH
ncbi:hypothetical protein J3Q64DRAFT_1235141 [Phycomyces blakesleeanus]|uniref:MADS-box transcription factor n=1 Tax=Phycomyces blakesleeanus TaxID=4837 RepID=A0ABR3BBD9_PHYBL